MGLRFKFTMAMLIVLSLAIVSMAGFSFFQQKILLREGMGKNVEIIARCFSGSAKTSLLRESQKSINEALETQKQSTLTITASLIMLGTLISLVLGSLLSRSSAAEAQRMRLKLRVMARMEKYLSGSTMQLIKRVGDSEQIKLGGERRYVVVLFSDIRGFTAMSEAMDPEEIVDLLNTYLNLQADVIQRRGGAVDKFIGDEIMAIFTGEDAELASARAAIEIQRFVRSLNAYRKRVGKKVVHVGIGINSGEVVMGNMGSKHQMDYTVIGDPVNTAARICAAAGSGQVIISQEVSQSLDESSKTRLLAPLEVKGKRIPLKVYGLLAVDNAGRRYLRKAVRLTAVYVLPGTSEGACPTLIHDIGMGGCVIETDRAIDVGSSLELTIDSKRLDRLRAVAMTVHHSRKSKERRLIGLEFKALSSAAYKQLGEYVYTVETDETSTPT